MSLVTRLLGVALCLVGGVMIGYVQGVQSIVDGVGNILVAAGANTPNVGSVVGASLAGFVATDLNSAYGSYWVFGIILAIFGLILVARGDRKARPPEEPLLQPQPVPVKQQE